TGPLLPANLEPFNLGRWRGSGDDDLVRGRPKAPQRAEVPLERRKAEERLDGPCCRPVDPDPQHGEIHLLSSSQISAVPPKLAKSSAGVHAARKAGRSPA